MTTKSIASESGACFFTTKRYHSTIGARLKPLPPFYAQNIILIVEKHYFNSKKLKAKLSLTLLLLLGRLFPNGSPTRFPNPLPNECWPNGCRLCPPLKLLNPLSLSLINHFIPFNFKFKLIKNYTVNSAAVVDSIGERISVVFAVWESKGTCLIASALVVFKDVREITPFLQCFVINV